MKRNEVATAAVWYAGALLIVGGVGYSIWRAGRSIARRRKAGAR